MTSLVWVKTYHDFTQSQQNVAQSHNCTTVIFRTSASNKSTYIHIQIYMQPLKNIHVATGGHMHAPSTDRQTYQYHDWAQAIGQAI